jgi:hypothetical protein
VVKNVTDNNLIPVVVAAGQKARYLALTARYPDSINVVIYIITHGFKSPLVLAAARIITYHRHPVTYNNLETSEMKGYLGYNPSSESWWHAILFKRNAFTQAIERRRGTSRAANV